MDIGLEEGVIGGSLVLTGVAIVLMYIGDKKHKKKNMRAINEIMSSYDRTNPRETLKEIREYTWNIRKKDKKKIDEFKKILYRDISQEITPKVKEEMGDYLSRDDTIMRPGLRCSDILVFRLVS